MDNTTDNDTIVEFENIKASMLKLFTDNDELRASLKNATTIINEHVKTIEALKKANDNSDKSGTDTLPDGTPTSNTINTCTAKEQDSLMNSMANVTRLLNDEKAITAVLMSCLASLQLAELSGASLVDKCAIKGRRKSVLEMQHDRIRHAYAQEILRSAALQRRILSLIVSRRIRLKAHAIKSSGTTPDDAVMLD